VLGTSKGDSSLTDDKVQATLNDEKQRPHSPPPLDGVPVLGLTGQVPGDWAGMEKVI